jgi:hypothetical protein
MLRIILRIGVHQKSLGNTVLPGVPGILTLINKSIEPLIFKLLWLSKNNSALDNSKKKKKIGHKHKITPRA